VGRRRLELPGDWLTVAGAAALFASLFLTWSHQFPASLPAQPGLSVALRGVPRNPDAWQVYSIADVLLAALAAALAGVSLRGARRARLALLAPVAVGLAFAGHAAGSAPTNGLDVVNPAVPGRGYVGSRYATSGGGETVAIAGLAVALAGLGLGLVSGVE
jgi:hypothetical protein